MTPTFDQPVDPTSSDTYILLGTSQELAFAELVNLASRFGLTSPVRVTQQMCRVSGEVNPQELIRSSGGIVKIYQTPQGKGTAPAIISKDLIMSNQAHFALSSIQNKTKLMDFASEVRAGLIRHGLKPHFRLLEKPYASAGIVSKSTEYLITEDESLPPVLKAVAAQDLYHWTAKDYGRPRIDPHSGMMPPKIARMMVNLGLETLPQENVVVYDPFCGSGTILVEALDLGCSVIGSDLSARAVEASYTNCEWFTKKFAPPGHSRVFAADVNHLTHTLLPNQVDAIVFEGYLGPSSPQYERIPNLVKGLEKMYRGVFKHLQPFLKPGGIIVCALPEFVLPTSVKNLDKVIDWATTLGYTRRERFTYGRPQAVVKRAIYVLQKTGN